MKSDIHNKDFARRLLLKEKLRRTREWPIVWCLMEKGCRGPAVKNLTNVFFFRHSEKCTKNLSPERKRWKKRSGNRFFPSPQRLWLPSFRGVFVTVISFCVLCCRWVKLLFFFLFQSQINVYIYVDRNFVVNAASIQISDDLIVCSTTGWSPWLLSYAIV